MRTARPNDDNLLDVDQALPPEGDGASTEATPRPPLLRRPAVWVGVGLGVAAILGAILAVVLVRQPTTGLPSHPGTPGPGTPIRVAFSFPVGAVASSSLSGRGAPSAVNKAADGVQSALSTFYDQAFVDPVEWTKGPPASAWDVFAKDVVGRARKDASSLTLGTVDGLDGMAVGRTLLEVRVLLDPSLHAAAAIGTVSFDATGTLHDGGTLTVHSTARFLLRPEANRWVIVAYPAATTKVDEVPAPQPGPSAGTASAALPTPAGSPS